MPRNSRGERREQDMALVRWSPFHDLLSVRDEMNRLFNDAFGRASGEEGVWASGAWVPPVDIYETDDAIVMKAELPGFSKDEVSIELKDHTLLMKGERKRDSEVKDEHFHRMERSYGSFQRSFLLPEMVDQEKVSATYKDGVLELRLPKAETAKPKRIAISG
jgi:HSP20 family protein